MTLRRARTAPRGRFCPAPAQRGGHHDPDDGRDRRRAAQPSCAGLACEPEICDLATLSACLRGAHCRGRYAGGGGTGRQSLCRATAWTPLPDRIAAATYAAALACAGGAGDRHGLRPGLLCGFSRLFAGGGRGCLPGQDTTRHAGPEPRPCLCGAGNTLCANAWPAFATDTAPLAAAVLLTGRRAPARSTTTCLPAALPAPQGFTALGARCRTVRGRTLLYGRPRSPARSCECTAPDLRGGAALLLAALAAEGVTLLRDPGHIPRGILPICPGAEVWGRNCALGRQRSIAGTQKHAHKFFYVLCQRTVASPRPTYWWILW